MGSVIFCRSGVSNTFNKPLLKIPTALNLSSAAAISVASTPPQDCPATASLDASRWPANAPVSFPFSAQSRVSVRCSFVDWPGDSGSGSPGETATKPWEARFMRKLMNKVPLARQAPFPQAMMGSSSPSGSSTGA